MIIVKEFTFDAAHKLPWHKGLCGNLHGHTYKLQVAVEGKLISTPKAKNYNNGVITDFGDIKKIVTEDIISQFDHQLLNDIYPNPTAEIMSLDILKKLRYGRLIDCVSVKLWETPTSYAQADLEDL
jgi:6-pyruvoyltetrahydropterin/6-carboxytetrahydropterin synthase